MSCIESKYLFIKKHEKNVIKISDSSSYRGDNYVCLTDVGGVI